LEQFAAQALSLHQSGPQPGAQDEHEVVTPSQVTCPGSGQLPSTAEQELPLQLTVPPFQQFAEQKDFTPKAGFLAEGFLAASSGAGVPAGRGAREARKA